MWGQMTLLIFCKSPTRGNRTQSIPLSRAPASDTPSFCVVVFWSKIALLAWPFLSCCQGNSVHALSARSLSGSPGVAPQLPDHDLWNHRHVSGQRFLAGRRDGGCGGHAALSQVKTADIQMKTNGTVIGDVLDTNTMPKESKVNVGKWADFTAHQTRWIVHLYVAC